MAAALDILEGCPDFARLVPEVRVNVACALPGAATPREVAAIDGRLTVVRGLPRACGRPAWGASDHLARRIIQARKYDSSINAALNFRYSPVIARAAREYCSEKGISFGWLDRSAEPGEAAGADGASMPWKVGELYRRYSGIPRVFYEGPGWGKEPLFLALGGDAVEVALVAVAIAVRLSAVK